MLRAAVTLVLLFYFVLALTTPARAYDCASVREYVAKVGLLAAIAAARSHGLTIQQIAVIRRQCTREARR